MSDHENCSPGNGRTPWNKGKTIGARPPLRSKHVWSIRTRLQVEGRVRDLAMFNLAIDSKLRGCDVVALKVEDVAPERLCDRPCKSAAEKDWSPGQIRTDRSDPPSCRCLPENRGQKIGRLSIHWKTW